MKALCRLTLALLCASAFGQEITVAAAADMSAALPELAATYTKKTGQAVKLSFGASGNLTNQIRNCLLYTSDVYKRQSIARAAPLTIRYGVTELYPFGM